MVRHLLLFAREPGREARTKGFLSPAGAELFDSFARGWLVAAAAVGARVTLAAPAEDMPAWRKRIPERGVDWIAQRGASLGRRLFAATRAAARPNEALVLVGGDVPPDAAALSRAFELLDGGAEAVLAPARDGGVSLVALSAADLDLLEGVRSGSQTVFYDLAGALAARGRRTAVLSRVPDVDRRADLRRLFRSIVGVPRSLIRSALDPPPFECGACTRSPRTRRQSGPSGLRAPPAAA